MAARMSTPPKRGGPYSGRSHLYQRGPVSPFKRGNDGNDRAMATRSDLQAIILVGGEGTRLRPLTYGTPKPMVPLLGVPFLERTLYVRSRGRDKQPIAIECKWQAGNLESKNIEIFLNNYPQANVLVVSNDTKESYSRKIGPAVIKYLNLSDCISILHKV